MSDLEYKLLSNGTIELDGKKYYTLEEMKELTNILENHVNYFKNNNVTYGKSLNMKEVRDELMDKLGNSEPSSKVEILPQEEIDKLLDAIKNTD